MDGAARFWFRFPPHGYYDKWPVLTVNLMIIKKSIFLHIFSPNFSSFIITHELHGNACENAVIYIITHKLHGNACVNAVIYIITQELDGNACVKL